MTDDQWIDFALHIIDDLRDTEGALEQEFVISDDYEELWRTRLQQLAALSGRTEALLRQRLDGMREHWMDLHPLAIDNRLLSAAWQEISLKYDLSTRVTNNIHRALKWPKRFSNIQHMTIGQFYAALCQNKIKVSCFGKGMRCELIAKLGISYDRHA